MPHPITLPWKPIAVALKCYYQQHLIQTYCQLPPDYPLCSHRKLATVCQWLHPIASATWSQASRSHDLSLSYEQQQRVARFFCACTPCAAGHHSMMHVSFLDRKCHMCDTGAVGNEQHIVMNCPAMKHVRDMYPGLDFTMPMSRLFALHTADIALYQYLAKVVRLADFVSMHPP